MSLAKMSQVAKITVFISYFYLLSLLRLIVWNFSTAFSSMKTTMIAIGYQLERIPMICLAFLTQHWSVINYMTVLQTDCEGLNTYQ